MKRQVFAQSDVVTSRKCWCFEKLHWNVFVVISSCDLDIPRGMHLHSIEKTTRRANRGAGRHTTRRHASEFHTSSPKTIGRFEDAPRPALAWRRAASRTQRSLAWLGRVVVVRRRATARPVIGATVREAHGGGWSGRSHLAFPPTGVSAIAIAGPGFLAFIVLFFVRFHRDSRGRGISCSRRSDTAPIRRPLASA